MNTSQILNHTADLLNTATTTLLAHPKALDRAPELMELHLAEGKVRAAVTDQPTEEPPRTSKPAPHRLIPARCWLKQPASWTPCRHRPAHL